MLTFYIKFRKLNDPVEIGTESFTNFWCNDGWYHIVETVSKKENLNEFEIIDNNNKKYSLKEFLTYLKTNKLNVIQ